MSMQRIRVSFRRGRELKYISHLDIIRLWQRACTRAGIPLTYSEGFSPRPRISIASPLPLGIIGEAELMDVYCNGSVTPHNFIRALNSQLPEGMGINQALLVMVEQPALQALLSQAEYLVDVSTDKTEDEIEQTIAKLLASAEIPWQHRRDTGIKEYDLRSLVDDVKLQKLEEHIATLVMRLRCDNNGVGRPEQVALALGFKDTPHEIRRIGLILKKR
jgi:radical SAM-linked protein